MNLLQHIHGYHIIFGIYAIVQLIFIFAKWDWIKEALSEKNAPSSMRLSGFMLVQLVIFCEVWHTMKTAKFDTTHLLYLLVSIGVLFGIIKVAQVMQMMGKSPAKEEPKTGDA